MTTTTATHDTTTAAFRLISTPHRRLLVSFPLLDGGRIDALSAPDSEGEGETGFAVVRRDFDGLITEGVVEADARTAVATATEWAGFA